VPDAIDNCPSVANPLQEDIDGDDIGDACDPGDFDLDSYSDRVEFSAGTDRGAICPSSPAHNANPADTDNDGFSDITDITALAASFGLSVAEGAPARHDIAPDPVDGTVDITDIVRIAGDFGSICADADADVIHDGIDNCLTVSNPLQEDVDGDNAGDACDNCPNWPNASQSLPPWPVPANDPDCDGFSATVENSAGTDPFDNCPDDPSDNAWPADIDNDTFSDITEITALAASFGQPVPPAPTRHDIAPAPVDAFVDITDIVRMAGFFGQMCV
jgi:hypothetical protein